MSRDAVPESIVRTGREFARIGLRVFCGSGKAGARTESARVQSIDPGFSVWRLMRRASLILLLLFSVSAEAFSAEPAAVPEPSKSAQMSASHVEPDPFAAATEVLSFSFEENEDELFDRLPDGWTRRRGTGFPGYVRCQIDDESGQQGTQSLRVDVSGGRVAYYSPFDSRSGRVDPAFNYVFRGYIRTEHLRHDAAVFSVSFLSARRERLQSFQTRPVSGTHPEWVKLELGPVQPHPEARFVTLGCHLMHGREYDISGQVWFDSLWLGKLPRLRLVGDVRAHYLTPDRPIEIDAHVSGLEPGVEFKLFMTLSDVEGQTLEQQSWDLASPSGQSSLLADASRRVQWKIGPRQQGCYFVKAHLERGGRLMLLSETTIAVMDSARSRSGGEFGWSMTDGPGTLNVHDLAWVAGQAGINWVKLPVWKTVHGEDAIEPLEMTELLERLADQSISTVGLLNDPPASIRRQFASQWAGISEVFALPPEFWGPSLEPVLARFGSAIEYWQLGGDEDFSFTGLKGLEQSIPQIKSIFDRIGRSSRIGIQWQVPFEAQPPDQVRDLVVTLNNAEGLNEENLEELLSRRESGHTERWVQLRPLPPGQPVQQRAIMLVRQMLAARVHGAPGIFLSDVTDPESGVLQKGGAPGPLFLPWRTGALLLRQSRYLGSLRLPGLPTNHVFERDGKAMVVFVSDQPMSVSANIGDNIQQVDLWGRRQAVPRTGDRHQLAIGPSPVFCTDCSEPLVRWSLLAGFEKGRIPSEYGGHPEAIIGRNTFPQGIRGTVRLQLPRDWEAEPDTWDLELAAGEAFRLPLTLTLPQNASLGSADVVIQFDITSDRPRSFEVYRGLEVGLGDVVVRIVERELPDGRLEIEQIVTNRTEPLEILDFKCNLSVSGQKTQTQYVTRLGQDEDRKIYYLPDAEALRGQELWLNLEQIGGRRNLNKRMLIGEHPQDGPQAWRNRLNPPNRLARSAGN